LIVLQLNICHRKICPFAVDFAESSRDVDAFESYREQWKKVHGVCMSGQVKVNCEKKCNGI